jgi:Na+-transporting methylmalonyl-CoA/oxaloacetate decarboxylase gamma subunit
MNNDIYFDILKGLYILVYGLGFVIITLLLFIIVSLVIYFKTGVHVKGWLEEKFPTD